MNQNSNKSIYFLHLKNDLNENLTIDYIDNKYQIFQRNEKNVKKIWIEFNSKKLNYRTNQKQKKEPLAKAVGIKKNYYPNILDATAGFGTDAFILASLGCQVLMLERNPIVAILLANGLDRGFKNKKIGKWLKKKLSLLYTSSEKFLIQTKTIPDVIYLDPMFPIIKKKAKSKKTINILKTIVKEQDNSNLLLNPARLLAKKRVVVKRPLHAPFLNNVKTYSIIKTKKHRFDIYQPFNKEYNK
ncbi:class I SAM-dependent methyltransferase [Buchnera aphidicola]|uniref:class I SAM-dependent methyltransferase n=1 Tax=Buchnera aphidicola TaxID=9 RepID=UPI003463D819